MKSRLILPISLVAFGLLTFWIVPKVLSGEYLQFLIIGGLLLILIVKMAEPIWTGLTLALLCLGGAFALPLPILEKLTWCNILVMIITGWVLLQSAISKNLLPKNALQRWEVRCMIFTAAVIFLRFFYDRPFSATIGERGGGSEAVLFVIGAVAYFTMLKITNKIWNVKRNFKVVLTALILIAAFNIFENFISGQYVIIPMGFWHFSWFLLPLLMAMILKKQEDIKVFSIIPNIALYFIILIILMMGFTSSFRSRPFFAFAMIIAVALAFHRTKIILPKMVAGALAVLVVMFITGGGKIPDTVARSISTIVSVDEQYVHVTSRQMSGEMGWASDFRWNMLEAAWEDIQEAPVLGKGFVFSRGQFFSTFLVGGDSQENIQGIIMAGQYHNAIVQLAQRCGIPCALAFLIAFITSLANFISYVRKSALDQVHVLSAGILSLFVASSGQMLMNGGGGDFFIICTLMGVMRGLSMQMNNRDQIGNN